MKKIYHLIKDTLFDESLGFRALIFNTVTLLGFSLALGFGLYSIIDFSGAGNVAGNFIAAAIVGIFILGANYTKAFRWFLLLTVILLFIIIFPILFFANGGYHGGMPCFFIFAIVFTVIMLEGWQRTAFTILELALYFGCLLTAYFHPETVTQFPTYAHGVRDSIVGCIVTAIVLAVAIHRHIVIYDRKMDELEKANDALQGLNRMKSEFLQDIKHEIQNPLQVISLGTDSAHEHMDVEGGTAEAHKVLYSVQHEAIRLGRMINGMVELATMGGDQIKREKVDYADMLKSCAEAFRLQLEKKQTNLRVDIAPNLPYVYAEAEQLERIPVNLLSNAMDGTQEGEIVLEASCDANYITICVRDTGKGISPELLPKVFERGVSGKGSKGYGLAMCKTIVEAHGGAIEIESEQGKGTAVTFTIPVYGGQSEERKYEQ